MVRWGDIGLARALFLVQNSIWETLWSSLARGFMVAMACTGATQLGLPSLASRPLLASLVLNILTTLKYIDKLQECFFHQNYNLINAVVPQSLISLLLLAARSVMETLPCCRMYLATASSSSWLM